MTVACAHAVFAASSREDLAARRRRLLDHGHDVIEIDHGWCTSIYANDPNGTLVEFCCTTRRFTEADVEEAERLIASAQPPLGATPPFEVYEAAKD